MRPVTTSRLLTILRWGCFWLAWLCAGGASSALAASHATDLPDGLAECQLAVLRDPSAALTFDDILNIERSDDETRFAALPQHGISAGYTHDAFWLRVTVRKKPEAPDHWRLLINTAHLDDVRFFLPRSSGVQHSSADFSELRAGDRVAVSARPLPARMPLVQLELPDSGSRQLYIRIQTTGTLVGMPAILNVADYMRVEQQRLMRLYLFFGTLLTMIAICLMYSLWLKDRSIGLYCLLLFVQLLGHASVEGVLGLMVLPEHPLFVDRLVGFSAFFGYALATLLFSHLTNLKAYFPRLNRFQWLVSMILAVVACSSFTPFFTALAPLGRLLLPPVTLIILASAIQDARRKSPGAIWIALAYAALAGFMTHSTLIMLGIVGSPPNPLTSQTLAALVQITLIQAGIAARAHHAQRSRQESAFQWQRAMENAERDQKLHETQEQFLYMVAHEVRTPLSVITAATGSLRLLVSEHEPQIENRIARIDRAVHRMERLFELCLDADLIERQQDHPKRWPTHPGQLLVDIASAMGSNILQRFVLDDQAKDTVIPLDRRLMGICFSNLLDNAFKYSPDATPIEVRIVSTSVNGAAQLQIDILDQGPGIPETVREKVFEKHFRARELNDVPGLGLGLYLSRQVIRQHGGSITAMPGNSGFFRILLPLTEEVPDAPNTLATEQK
jgi:signal transduction histidine kinase